MPSDAGDGVEQRLDLAVDDDRVEPLLAAEVLVDDRLADLGRRRDLLDAGALEPLLGEQLAADVEQLLAPLLAGHPGRGLPSAGRAGRIAAREPSVVTASSLLMRASARGGEPVRASASGRRSPSRASRTARSPGRWSRSGRAATPCRAQVGSAWCRLCQDSPIDSIASHQTLPARSRVANGRSPRAWQIELIDQVTWCSSADPHERGPEERGQRALPGPGSAGRRAAPAASSETATRAGRPRRPGRCRGPRAGRARSAAGWSARRRTASRCARRTGP